MGLAPHSGVNALYTVCTRCGQHMPEPRRAVVTGLDHDEGRLRAIPHALPLPAPQRATGLRRTRYPPARLCSASHFLPVNRATSPLSMRRVYVTAISDAQSPPTLR